MIPSNTTTKERQGNETDRVLRALVAQLPALMAQAQAQTMGFPPPPAPVSEVFDETGHPRRWLCYGDKVGDYPMRPLRSVE